SYIYPLYLHDALPILKVPVETTSALLTEEKKVEEEESPVKVHSRPVTAEKSASKHADNEHGDGKLSLDTSAVDGDNKSVDGDQRSEEHTSELQSRENL